MLSGTESANTGATSSMVAANAAAALAMFGLTCEGTNVVMFDRPNKHVRRGGIKRACVGARAAWLWGRATALDEAEMTTAGIVYREVISFW